RLFEYIVGRGSGFEPSGLRCSSLGGLPFLKSITYRPKLLRGERFGAPPICVTYDSGASTAPLGDMYHHIKQLMYTVRIGQPDPRFGNMLLEQFGGANGELAAAMQYSIQGINCDDPERKDLLMDIGTEELSHLEVVG